MTEIPITIVETPVIAISKPSSLPLVGMKLGAKMGAWMSPLYLILVLVGVLGMEVILNRTIVFTEIGVIPFLVLLVCVVGGVPVILLGTIAGGVIGWILTLSHAPWSWQGAVTVGVGVGGVMLLLPNLWMGMALAKGLSVVGSGAWLQLLPIWYFPCLFALLGLGWVAYRLNRLIPE
jgi:hypothetical protein